MATPPATVDAVLRGVRLSTMPAVAARLVDATAAEHVDVRAVAELVGLDHALTSIVLRAAGAGGASPCGSVPSAVDRLGVATVTSLAMGSMLAEGFDDRDAPFDETTFRRWSIHTAVSAKAVAKAAGVWDADEAYATALLQDAGVLAMAQRLGSVYARMLSETQNDHHRLAPREREQWGFDHEQVGAEAARRWRLPDHCVHAIAHHHDATKAAKAHTAQTRVLDLAGALSAALLSHAADDAMRSFRARADEWFALGAGDTEDLVRVVSDEATALLSLLRIESTDAPNVERLLLRAEEQWVRHQARVGRRTRELERRNRDLARRADCDTLTGVGTRGLLERELPAVVRRCAAQGKPLAVAFIDLDGFKPINDTLGHAVGDDVLRRAAAAIRTAAGEDSIVCRFGGDEFVVIMPGRDLADASMAAECMRRDVAVHGRRATDNRATVTLSIGCAALGPKQLGERAGHRLVSAADEAMYVAKRSGGNAVECIAIETKAIDDVRAA
jgi:diguanylate cyclase (GGDEF)-like protein